MKLKNIAIALAAAGMLGATGFGLYRLGIQHGAGMSAGAPATGAASAAQAPAAAVDPSTWGVPEG